MLSKVEPNRREHQTTCIILFINHQVTSATKSRSLAVIVISEVGTGGAATASHYLNKAECVPSKKNRLPITIRAAPPAQTLQQHIPTTRKNGSPREAQGLRAIAVHGRRRGDLSPPLRSPIQALACRGDCKVGCHT